QRGGTREAPMGSVLAHRSPPGGRCPRPGTPPPFPHSLSTGPGAGGQLRRFTLSVSRRTPLMNRSYLATALVSALFFAPGCTQSEAASAAGTYVIDLKPTTDGLLAEQTKGEEIPA